MPFRSLFGLAYQVNFPPPVAGTLSGPVTQGVLSSRVGTRVPGPCTTRDWAASWERLHFSVVVEGSVFFQTCARSYTYGVGDACELPARCCISWTERDSPGTLNGVTRRSRATGADTVPELAVTRVARIPVRSAAVSSVCRTTFLAALGSKVTVCAAVDTVKVRTIR